MPLHPDAIPTSEQVRETLFDRYYFPYKKQIWAFATLVVLAIVATLAVREWHASQRDEQWTRFAAALRTEAAPGAPEADQIRALEEQTTLLRRLVTDFPKAPVTPYALIEVAASESRLKRFEDARATLARLRTEFPEFVLCRSTTADFGDGAAIPLADRLDATLRAEAEWAKATAYVHPEPTKNRAALVETTAGNFWIGFYPDQAPRHVEQFITLAKSGWFNGTQVYQTRTNLVGGAPSPMLFEAGSAASKVNDASTFAADPALHDRDEPDNTIEPDNSRYTIRHRRGVVCAVAMASGESARRFAVITAPNGMETTLRGRNTIFGAILDREQSITKAEQITMAPTYGTAAETKDNPTLSGARDHPNPPIYIRRVSIWSDERIESGHEWDTARVGKPEAEPWEPTK